MVGLIYFAMVALIMAFGCLEVGSRSSDKQEQTSEEGLMSYAIAAVFWPAIVACVMVATPFYMLYKIGRVLRSIR